MARPKGTPAPDRPELGIVMATEVEAAAAARGFQTSEFWLTVLGVVALVVLVITGDVEGTWAAGAIGLACFGYQASRAVVKQASVSGDSQVANFRADLEALARAQD